MGQYEDQQRIKKEQQARLIRIVKLASTGSTIVTLTVIAIIVYFVMTTNSCSPLVWIKS